MKSTRKMLALVLALVMCLAFFPASASAAGIIASGAAGPNSEFVLYGDGRMIINGTGQVNPNNQWSFSTWPTGYTSAQDAIRATRSMVKTLEVGQGITTLSNQAFSDMTKLYDVTLPASLTTINQRAFALDSSLLSISIPASVTTIAQGTFFDCSSLSSVYLPEGLLQINANAFDGCTSLRTIEIPANVNQIGSQAFANCGSLTEIYFYGNAPMISGDAFLNVRADVYYPVDNDSWNATINPMVANPQYSGRLTWHTSGQYTGSDGWVNKGTAANPIWYYYMNGLMVRDNWVSYQGCWFYFDENGRMLNGGHTLVHDKFYFFANNGVRMTGRQQDPNDGQWRFYDDNGVYVPGYAEVDDGLNMFRNGWQRSADGTKWYYIKDKAKVKGWIKDGAGYWYYLDPTTGAMVTGWLEWNGNTYYLRPLDMATADGIPDREGSMVAGRTQQIGGVFYTFNKDGALQGGKVDQNPLGNLVDSGWRQELDANGNPGGPWHFYRSDGTMVSGGWELINNNWYYFNNDGAMRTGWLNWNGDWYYLTPGAPPAAGVMVTGFQNISSTPQGVALGSPKTYFFKSNGALNGRGWIQVGGKWYYLRDDGALHTGWLKDGKNWFYLDDGTNARPNGSGNFNRGEMVTGLYTVPTYCDGQPNDQPGPHSFKANGVWLGAGDQGHKSTAGGWSGDQYKDTDGVVLSGWQYIDGKWYYLNPANDNKRAKGVFQDDTAAWFFTDGNGALQLGWQNIGGTWYYFNKTTGARVTGWLQDGGKWYYLNTTTGGMVSNTTLEIDGEYWAFNSDGVCTGKVAG